jgi:hypothetical protein
MKRKSAFAAQQDQKGGAMWNGRKASVSVCSLAALLLASPAVSHDLPATEHPATLEVLDIEQLLASQPATAKSNQKLFSFVATRLLWKPGLLRACFWNGTPEKRAKVVGFANTVAALTPVRFDWVEQGAFRSCQTNTYSLYPVRISLEANPALLNPGDNAADFFAGVGNRLRSDLRRATVNLPFTSTATEEFVREKTLHEFCHVLGCLHEHQRGACDADFNKAWIQTRYRLDDAQYETNILGIPSSDVVYGAKAFSDFDDDSIMLYTFAKEAFSNPASKCLRQATVATLSPDDQSGLRRAYALQADPRLGSAADFQRLADAAGARALEKRREALELRSVTSQWVMSRRGAERSERLQTAGFLESLAVRAEAEAEQARETEETFRLTPLAEQRLAAFLATLPPQD